MPVSKPQRARRAAILAVGVLWQERTAEQTLDLLSPLWDWLMANRRGLIHADGEGFWQAGTGSNGAISARSASAVPEG